jgi:hypothetical protein
MTEEPEVLTADEAADLLRVSTKSVFLTFGRFLLLALVIGMIGGHDHHRRHPGARAALAGDPAPDDPNTTRLMWRDWY